jgi:predicted nucleic acid-binding protein
MPGRFLDTNIFVYTFDKDDSKKRSRAEQIVSDALEGDGAIISSQVIQEFLNLALTRFATPLTPGDASRYVRTVLLPLCRVWASPQLFERAVGIHSTTGFSFYDSLIVAAALTADCTELITEDLQHDRKIEGLRITNPF